MNVSMLGVSVSSWKYALGVFYLQSTVAKYHINLCSYLEIWEDGNYYYNCAFIVSTLWCKNTQGIRESKLASGIVEKVILSILWLLMHRTVFSNLWHHLISFCFPHDPGNNRWKSQLLRVLSKRSLCPDKAAQVLLAKGIAYSACSLESCLTMPGMERLPPWDAGSHWHLVWSTSEGFWSLLMVLNLRGYSFLGSVPGVGLISCNSSMWYGLGRFARSGRDRNTGFEISLFRGFSFL